MASKTSLHISAYNKGNVVCDGFGSAFRLSAVSAQAGRIVCHGGFRKPCSWKRECTVEPESCVGAEKRDRLLFQIKKMTGDDAGTVWSGIDQAIETGSNEF